MAPLFRRANDDAAFERLYQRHVQDVYRYSYAVLGEKSDAEDVTQTTFMNAYRAFQNGERPEKPQNWLITIAHNVCRQRFRQQQRRPHQVEFDEAVSAAPEESEGPSAEDLRRAFSQLPPNQRAALVMRELEGRSYAEIAEVLDVSVSALETLLFRARRALREQLEEQLTCSEAAFSISKQFDGRLSEAEQRSLRAHLRACPECASASQRQRAQRRALRSMLAVPLPQSLASFFGGAGTASSVGAASAVGSGVALKAAAVLTAGAVAGSAYVGAKQTQVFEHHHRRAAAPARLAAVAAPTIAVVAAARVPRAESFDTKPAVARAKQHAAAALEAATHRSAAKHRQFVLPANAAAAAQKHAQKRAAAAAAATDHPAKHVKPAKQVKPAKAAKPDNPAKPDKVAKPKRNRVHADLPARVSNGSSKTKHGRTTTAATSSKQNHGALVAAQHASKQAHKAQAANPPTTTAPQAAPPAPTTPSDSSAKNDQSHGNGNANGNGPTVKMPTVTLPDVPALPPLPPLPG
jgi:RNA polymerase sigma factor (sigma-70 family)